MVYETLKELFIAICDSVRQKDGSVGLIDHQDIPDRILEIKGIDTSGATAEAKDIANGKTAFVNGEMVTGELAHYGDPWMIPNSSINIAKKGSQIVANTKTTKDFYSRAGMNINFEINNSRFGDARPEDVAYGKTFTSIEGFMIKGTHECSVPEVETEPIIEVDSLSDVHYWTKTGSLPASYEKEKSNDRVTLSRISNGSWTEIRYSSKIIPLGNTLSLEDPIVLDINGENDTDELEELLRGKFVYFPGNTASYQYYEIPRDAGVLHYEASSNQGERYLFTYAYRLIPVPGDENYSAIVVSDDSTTYPENGEQDGYTYVYKGTLDAAGEAAVIQALTITANGTYSAPASVDGYSPITVNVTAEDIPIVSQAVPVIELSTSDGLITVTATQDSGQVPAGTQKVTKQLPTQTAKTYTPGTSDQVIPAGKYLTGAQTIKGDANLTADNIPEGVTIFGIAGKRKMSSADLSDIGKLHFWEKYRVDPTINYVENEKENVSLLVYRYFAGTTSNYHIYYGDTFTFDEETKQFSLSSKGYCNTLDAAQANLPGKYIRYNDNYGYIYFVPEDAVITQTTSSTVGTSRSIVIDKATQLLVNNPLGYVASEESETYPENGEHSDGYWYVYRGLLADAISQ